MMIDDDNDGQMIAVDLGGLKRPDICLTAEEKPWKNLTQKTCPDRGSNPGPLRDRRACYLMTHSGGREYCNFNNRLDIDSGGPRSPGTTSTGPGSLAVECRRECHTPLSIQGARKFPLQTSMAYRGNWEDNVFNRNPCPETYRFRVAGTNSN